MAGLMEWWMSRPFYDDPAKHGWGVALLQILATPIMWLLLPIFLMWGCSFGCLDRFGVCLRATLVTTQVE